MIACGFCGGNISTKEKADKHAEICLSFRNARDFEENFTMYTTLYTAGILLCITFMGVIGYASTHLGTPWCFKFMDLLIG